MLTVDYDRLGVGPGTNVIDVGCGAGRHSYEAYRRGADVIAFDQNAEELAEVDTMLQAMGQAGEAPASAKAQVVVGDREVGEVGHRAHAAQRRARGRAARSGLSRSHEP